MGQRYLLDTNICIHLINRRPGYEALLEHISQYSYGDLLISAITLAELRFGVAKTYIPHTLYPELEYKAT